MNKNVSIKTFYNILFQLRKQVKKQIVHFANSKTKIRERSGATNLGLLPSFLIGSYYSGFTIFF